MWLDVLLLYTTHSSSAVCLLGDPACGSPNAGVEDSSKVYTQLLMSLFKQCWASARKGLHGKSKLPPTGDAVSSKGSQSSSSVHKAAPNLCILLPQRCNSPSPLSCPCTQLTLQSVCFLLQESSLALLTAHEAESCKMVQGALFWFEALCWGLADCISTSFVLLVAMGYWKKLFLKMQEGQPYFCHFLTLNIWIQFSVGGGQASFLKR